jgi:hypothetical protein
MGCDKRPFEVAEDVEDVVNGGVGDSFGGCCCAVTIEDSCREF